MDAAVGHESIILPHRLQCFQCTIRKILLRPIKRHYLPDAVLPWREGLGTDDCHLFVPIAGVLVGKKKVVFLPTTFFRLLLDICFQPIGASK
jgi:hypothetical protein